MSSVTQQTITTWPHHLTTQQLFLPTTYLPMLLPTILIPTLKLFHPLLPLGALITLSWKAGPPVETTRNFPLLEMTPPFLPMPKPWRCRSSTNKPKCRDTFRLTMFPQSAPDISIFQNRWRGGEGQEDTGGRIGRWWAAARTVVLE